MCEGLQDAMGAEAHGMNTLYAAIIREQMKRQGTSLRALAQEGVIKNHRRIGFYERLENGSLTIGEFQRVLFRLKIDPIKADIALLCYKDPSSYEDPYCETTAQLAVSLATHLPNELAACDGGFKPIRPSLCDTIAKKNASAIAKHHMLIEHRQNGDGFEHAYG